MRRPTRSKPVRLESPYAGDVERYVDLGISPGMQQGIDQARAHRRQVVFRRLGGEWSKSEPSEVEP